MLTFLYISIPFEASSKATFWGVDTTKAPEMAKLPKTDGTGTYEKISSSY
jgi:hypothetical protein